VLPVDIPFAIAKYPITCVQMQAFYEAEDGYRQDNWWEGLAVQKKFWEQNQKMANCPAENVNWYTAVAFCRWLSQQIGLEIRLPTEGEWWLAATLGDQSRIYHWGKNWNSNCANTDEGRLGRTTAVGMYPDGAAACGALDMSGNVLEWCINEADNPDIVALNSGKWKAARGGAFCEIMDMARVVSRKSFSPINQFAFTGFRVMNVHPL
jgi:formylglycine-generating enzyme required for sulfatase activity